MNDLIANVPDELAEYQPRQKYFLLDIGRVSDAFLHNGENLAVQLVRLERSKNPEDIWAVVKTLRRILQSPENRILCKTFVLWINVIARRSGVIANITMSVNKYNELT